MAISISVQEEDFDVGIEYQGLVDKDTEAGAVVFFVGRVRDTNSTQAISGLFLEHYPGMTEKILQELVDEAKARWSLMSVRIIHRIGSLAVGDQIVYVGVTSAHREAAFQSAAFLMDYLKTRAPFWKGEYSEDNERHWVSAKESDRQASERWITKK